MLCGTQATTCRCVQKLAYLPTRSQSALVATIDDVIPNALERLIGNACRKDIDHEGPVRAVDRARAVSQNPRPEGSPADWKCTQVQ